jgi:hypothetical protein
MRKSKTTLAVVTVLGATALILNVQADNGNGNSLKVEGTPLGGGVPFALARTNSPDNVLAPGFSLELVAQGIELLENPSGVITHFGFLSDTNDTKTEPDENLYLELDHNPGGPTPGYDYGRHFLFQGHENAGNLAYVTRINLDFISPDHRITLLTPVGTNGLTGFNSIDGSTWDPFSRTLLFTQEAGSNGGIIEMGADYDTNSASGAGLRTLYGSMGRGGFEGIHPDDWGNILIIEDAGGTTVNFGKNPNSFVYRFVPNNPADLSKGKLQALQVSINGSPLMFVPVDTNNPTGDMLSDNQLRLHTVGATWPVQWVTIHDTAVDGTNSFNANALAKAAGATPFKRSENAQFQPGSKFQTFFFDITGDTDLRAGTNTQLAARGAWGGIFRVDLAKNRQAGTISLVALGDAEHNSFDNLTFTDKNTLLAAEDRGDTLHAQLNALDSVWVYDVRAHNPQPPVRLLALGRDRFSTGGEDNEPTGVFFSDGNGSAGGLLGTKAIRPQDGLLFFTQQHGENNLYLINGSHQSED